MTYKVLILQLLFMLFWFEFGTSNEVFAKEAVAKPGVPKGLSQTPTQRPIHNQFKIVQVREGLLLAREDYSVQQLSSEEEECVFEEDPRGLPGRRFVVFGLGEKPEHNIKIQWDVRLSKAQNGYCQTPKQIQAKIAELRASVKSFGFDIGKIKDEDLLKFGSEFDEITGGFEVLLFDYPLTTPSICGQLSPVEECSGTKSLIYGKDYFKLTYSIRGKVTGGNCGKQNCLRTSVSKFFLETKKTVGEQLSSYESKVPFTVQPLRIILVKSKPLLVGMVPYKHDWINDSRSHPLLFTYKMEKKKSKK